ncbi:hypothetical protein B0J14DRAFT_578911 [Halenospora varia]|nr:hypothetical protein B0J14DRAFT_578911 [Halenospora varia]
MAKKRQQKGERVWSDDDDWILVTKRRRTKTQKSQESPTSNQETFGQSHVHPSSASSPSLRRDSNEQTSQASIQQFDKTRPTRQDRPEQLETRSWNIKSGRIVYIDDFPKFPFRGKVHIASPSNAIEHAMKEYDPTVYPKGDRLVLWVAGPLMPHPLVQGKELASGAGLAYRTTGVFPSWTRKSYRIHQPYGDDPSSLASWDASADAVRANSLGLVEALKFASEHCQNNRKLKVVAIYCSSKTVLERFRSSSQETHIYDFQEGVLAARQLETLGDVTLRLCYVPDDYRLGGIRVAHDAADFGRYSAELPKGFHHREREFIGSKPREVIVEVTPKAISRRIPNI